MGNIRRRPNTFGESFVFLSLLFPGTAVLIASGTLISDGVLNLLPTVAAELQALCSANRCHTGSARDLDLVCQKYGLSKDILSAYGRRELFARYGGRSVFIGRFSAHCARLSPWQLK